MNEIHKLALPVQTESEANSSYTNGRRLLHQVRQRERKGESREHHEITHADFVSLR